MNKLFSIGATLAMSVGTLFVASSCSNNEIEPMSQAQYDQEKYKKVFEARFGQPAANHDWGFVDMGTKAGTRTAYPNGNLWESEGWDVPEALTDAQKDIVRRYFQQNKEPQGVSIDYSDFFVQQVYKGATNTSESLTTEVYKAANGGDVVGSNMMNQLTAGSDNEHINNFNYGNCTDWNGLMLMVDSKTDCFGFSNSNDQGTQYNDQYVIISGDDIMSWARSNGKELAGADVSGMYFVGFDFEALPKADNSNLVNTNEWLGTEVAEGTEGARPVNGKWYIVGGADGYYSDWIVRIVPGVKKAPTPDARVIAEDLTVSDNGDFDFNDVVFDVKFNYPETGKATITLQAAGGTLPLYVGGEEVHAKFGVSTTTMVNTGDGPEKDPVSYVINYSGTNANGIKVSVQKYGSEQEMVEITAVRGQAPGKIQVPVTFQWCAERQDIEAKYSKFSDYVKNKDIDFWE
ncbi:MAG: hypothetical protein ACI4B3_09760 [Prevotella sp.]